MNLRLASIPDVIALLLRNLRTKHFICCASPPRIHQQGTSLSGTTLNAPNREPSIRLSVVSGICLQAGYLLALITQACQCLGIFHLAAFILRMMLADCFSVSSSGRYQIALSARSPAHPRRFAAWRRDTLSAVRYVISSLFFISVLWHGFMAFDRA